MLILSIDSASAGCGAAVWRDGTILSQRYESMERGQDRRLVPLILELMKTAGVTFDDLDRVAVTRGPGSFTGLRIGLAAARGIGLAAGKPVIGIDRFSVFRTQIDPETKNLLVVLNSKRKELYCRLYPKEGNALPATMWSEEEIVAFVKEHPATIAAGDVEIAGTAFSKSSLPEAVTVAVLGAAAAIDDPAFLPRPLYLRAPDVTIPKPVAVA